MSDIEKRALRLAMFSAAPPIPSGISAYLTDLLPLLPDIWDIDVFTDEGVDIDIAALSRGRSRAVAAHPHTSFAECRARAPYDLNVYQVGNSSDRTYVCDYVTQHPGLLVLHDAVVHPARLQSAIGSGDMHGYRRTAVACREDTGRALGHLVAGGLGGPSLYFGFPMCEDLVRASAVTGMHGELACGWLRSVVPDTVVAPLVHWRSVIVDEERRESWRRRLAPADEVVIGTFGNIGPERRLDRVLRSLAALGVGGWRLAVVGGVDGGLGLEELAAELGIADRVVWEGGLTDEDFVAAMAATDFAVNLRYPQVRASSGVLHQLLQLGVPALISDVIHWRDYPQTAVARIPPGPDEVENAALAAALSRWILDAEERRAAGAAAAVWAADQLTPDSMRRSYVDAVHAAITRLDANPD